MAPHSTLLLGALLCLSGVWLAQRALTLPSPGRHELPTAPARTARTTSSTTPVTTPPRPTASISPSANNSANDAEHLAFLPDKYLVIPANTAFAQLGFNNVRITIEFGLALARMLRRRVLVPHLLHMRHCSDAEACRRSQCEFRRDAYWCPIELFIPAEQLQAAGAVFAVDRPGLTRHVVHEAFDAIYDNQYLWFDTLPASLAAALTADGRLPEYRKTELNFDVFTYQLGCELSYLWPVKRMFRGADWHGQVTTFKGIADEWGAIDADVLVLEGRAMFVSRSPWVFSSLLARGRFELLWQRFTSQYHPDIVSLASAVAVELRSTGSFVAVHYRRGDFVDLGLLRAAEKVETVQAAIKSHLRAGEPFYLATNEHDPAILDSFRRMGAVLWRDVLALDAVQAHVRTLPVAAGMLCFEDYVGLVEQLVCAGARLFVGTHCSSFTGQILNLRRKIHGDTTFHALPIDEGELEGAAGP